MEVDNNKHSTHVNGARRQVRDLPAGIRNLRARLTTLAADQQTAEDSQHLPKFIGRQAILRADVPVVLETKLDAMSIKVVDTVRFPIGSSRGLDFGLNGVDRLSQVRPQRPRAVGEADLCPSIILSVIFLSLSK